MRNRGGAGKACGASGREARDARGREGGAGAAGEERRGRWNGRRRADAARASERRRGRRADGDHRVRRSHSLDVSADDRRGGGGRGVSEGARLGRRATRAGTTTFGGSSFKRCDARARTRSRRDARGGRRDAETRGRGHAPGAMGIRESLRRCATARRRVRGAREGSLEVLVVGPLLVGCGPFGPRGPHVAELFYMKLPLINRT